MTLSAAYYSSTPTAEYDAECDAAELHGYEDAIAGKTPARFVYFAFKQTCYEFGYRKGKAALAADTPF